VSDVRVVRNGDTRVASATVDIDGLPPTPEGTATQHHEVAATFTRSGSYLLSIVGRRQDAAVLRAVASESVTTIALDAAARPQGKDISRDVAPVGR
jgi:hypothetical protein